MRAIGFAPTAYRCSEREEGVLGESMRMPMIREGDDCSILLLLAEELD